MDDYFAFCRLILYARLRACVCNLMTMWPSIICQNSMQVTCFTVKYINDAHKFVNYLNKQNKYAAAEYFVKNTKTKNTL